MQENTCDRPADQSTVDCIWLSWPFWCVSCGVPAFDFHGRAGVFMMALFVDEEGPWCVRPHGRCGKLAALARSAALQLTCISLAVCFC